MKRSRNYFFACAMFSGDQNIGVGGANLPNEFKDGSHRGRIGQKGGARFRAQEAVFGLEARGLTQSLTQVDLRSKDGKQAVIFPGLCNEVSGAAAHRLDRQLNTDRKSVV